MHLADSALESMTMLLLIACKGNKRKPYAFLFQKETYEPPNVPLEKDTYYTQEFINKQPPLPEIRRFEPPRENFRKSSAKFDGRTTYKDNHKHWVGQKQTPFGELPSFAGNFYSWKLKNYLRFMDTKGNDL